MLKSLQTAFLVIFFAFLGTGEVSGQTYNITSTADFTLPAGNNGAIININYSGDGWGKIDIGSNTNVTIQISSNSRLGGPIIATNPYTLEVSGTLIGDRDLPSGSKLSFSSTGKTSNYGIIKLANGIFSNSGTVTNSLSFTGSTSGTNSGKISGQITVSENSSYQNNGSQTGNLTINASGSITNNGILDLNSLSFDTNVSSMTFNNTSSSTLKVRNPTTMSGSISLNGSSTFDSNVTFVTNSSPTTVTLNGIATFGGSLDLLANNGSNNVTVNIGEKGGVDIAETLSISKNGVINLFNSSNLSPAPYINAKDLNFRDAGVSGGVLNTGENTEVEISNQTSINGASGAQLNIGGSYTTSNMTSGGSGGSINLAETGSLTVANTFNLNGNLAVNIAGTLSSGSILSNGSGGNSFQVKSTGEVTTSGEIQVNGYAFSSEGNGKISIGGNLSVTNSGASKLNLNDNSKFYVNGNTSIDNLLEINDESFVTFKGNVNVGNSGSASLTLNDNADILIQSSLTKTSYWSGSVVVNGSSQFTVCDERSPTGTIDGSFPPDQPNDQIYIAPSAYYGACGILPVDFLTFQVSSKTGDRSALISWSTAKEWQNSHFEVERAVNTIADWETIGQVDGMGYSEAPSSYTFRDDDLPVTAGNVFYRLKQVNLDGTSSYSITRAIQLHAVRGDSFWITYPNPTRGHDLRLALRDQSMMSDSSIQVRLSTSLGQSEVIAGQTIAEINQNLQHSLRQKPAGIYLIHITWGSKQETLRIIKI